PNYRKQEGEPPRVQPSRQRRATAAYDTPEAEAEREKARAAMERRVARAAEQRAEFTGTRPTPTGRRRSTIPVIEISRAAKQEDDARVEVRERNGQTEADSAAAVARRRVRATQRAEHAEDPEQQPDDDAADSGRFRAAPREDANEQVQQPDDPDDDADHREKP